MTTDVGGVFAPIVTPFRPADGEVDYPWIAEHFAYLKAQGCDGLVACGTNGEAASLSVAERRAVLETALTHAGVLVVPPFFFKRPADAGIAAWFQRLCDAAVPPGGRVLLYHTTFPALAYFCGNDHLVGPACADGGAGSISAAANVFPDVVKAAQAAAQTAARDGGTATVLAAAQATLDDVRSTFERYPLQPATKAALSDVAGLPQTAVRPPQVELSPAQRAELRAILAEKLRQWRMTRTNQTQMSN